MKDEALKLALDALEYATTMSKFLLDEDANIGPMLKAEEAIEAINKVLAQPPEPRNFCPRCGKRTADLTVIHTCTPPEGGHQ